MISVTHVGPDMYSIGGTQSVIRVLRDNKIGADDIRVLSTWNGDRHLRNLFLTARAGMSLAGPLEAPSCTSISPTAGPGCAKDR